MKKKIIINHMVFLFFLMSPVFCQNKNNECSNYSFNKRDDLSYLKYIHRELLSAGKYIEIKDERRIGLVIYAKQIGNYIINEQTDLLLANMSNNNFKYYADDLMDDSGYVDLSKRSKDSFLKQFNDGMYYYYLIFKPQETKENELKNIKIKYVDLRDFLKCVESNSEWIVYYELKEKIYHVYFTVPEKIVAEYWYGPNGLYFHYVVSEEKDKYILVGF